jgi:hypothetical protein
MNCKFRLNPFPIETSTRQTNKQKDNEGKKTETDKSIGKTQPKQTPQQKSVAKQEIKYLTTN